VPRGTQGRPIESDGKAPCADRPFPSPRLCGYSLEHGQFPAAGSDVVAQYIAAAIVTVDFEIAVIWRKPAVKDVNHLDLPLTQKETPGRLLASVTGVTLDANPQCEYALNTIFFSLF